MTTCDTQYILRIILIGTVLMVLGIGLSLGQSRTCSTMPAHPSFEIASLQFDGWSIINGDHSKTWELATGIIGQSGNYTEALMINNLQYNSAGQEDAYQSVLMDIKGLTNPIVTFDVAYAAYSESYYDGLRIDVSTDLGNSFTSSGYNKSGSDLATAPNATSPWIPLQASDWRNDTLDLSSYNSGSVIIRFVNINGYGNKLYLDNILLHDNAAQPTVEGNFPFGIEVTNVTANAAELKWDPVTNAERYVVSIQYLGENRWANYPVDGASNSFIASGLSASYLYHWQVTAICETSGINASPYSDLDTFGLAAFICVAPTGLTELIIADQSAVVQWTSNMNAQEYELTYKQAAESTWSTLNISAPETSAEIASLSKNSSYFWRLRTICSISGNAISGYSSVRTFITKPFGAVDSINNATAKQELSSFNLFQIATYPNPVEDELYIEILNNRSDTYDVTFSDLAGNRIRKDLVAVNGKKRYLMRTKALAPGVYIVQVSNEQEAKRLKIVKY